MMAMIIPGKNNHHLVMPTRTVSGDEDTTIEFWWTVGESNSRFFGASEMYYHYTNSPKTTSKFLKNFYYYCLGCVVSH
jgi:hypothetical protein